MRTFYVIESWTETLASASEVTRWVFDSESLARERFGPWAANMGNEFAKDIRCSHGYPRLTSRLKQEVSFLALLRVRAESRAEADSGNYELTGDPLERVAYGYREYVRDDAIADAKALWEELGDVCVDGGGCIGADWRDYPAGTDREVIWHDIEEQYGEHGVTVARLTGLEPWPD